jgi:hypothetical protein
VIEGGAEHRRAIAALKRKYAQYRTSTPLETGAVVIALDAGQLSHWQSSSPGRRRAGRRDSPA